MIVSCRDWLKRMYDKTVETNSQVKFQVLQFLPFLIASFVSGLMAFVYSTIFHYAEDLSQVIYQYNSALIFVVTPVTFFVSWWLVRRFAPSARGSGIPQVMAAIELTKPNSRHSLSLFLSLKIILIKIASSSIKVIGGGILGREGPTIQITASIFNQVYKWIPRWWIPIAQKNILIAGAASGLAAAFNTPLGGIIFAIEELSKFPIKYYKYPLFLAIIIAGLTAQGFTGPYLYLGYPKTGMSGFIVYIGILLTAIASGYLGAKMCVVLVHFLQFVSRQKSEWKQYGIVLACALCVATPAYFFGMDAMGSGHGYMERILFSNDKTTAWYMPFVRIAGLVTTFGFGGAGGVFAPSLSSGAGVGALISQCMGIIGSNANILVLVGMGSFLTAVTRAPFTAAIIIFEMTDRHSIIFFLLLGCIIANLVATLVSRVSFYEILKETYLKDAGYTPKGDPYPGKAKQF